MYVVWVCLQITRLPKHGQPILLNFITEQGLGSMSDLVKEKTSSEMLVMPLKEAPTNQQLVPQSPITPRKTKRAPMRVPDDDTPRFVDLLGPKPLLAEENGREYVEYRRRIYQELDPRGPIEEMFANSAIYAYWDLQRFTAYKTNLMNACSKDALERILSLLVDDETKIRFLRGFSESDPVAREKLKDFLKSHQISLEDISAKALAENISVIQKIELLISIKEASWCKALKELEGRRDLLARRFRALHGIKEDEHFRGFPKQHPPAFS